MDYITMNQKELKQAKIFEQVKQGTITQAQAAKKIGISERWVRAKIKRYYEFQEQGLIHKSRGKESLKRWDPKKEEFVIDLLKSEWQGFGPTFAAEKLEEIHSIKISRETIRQAMIREKIWQANTKKIKHRKRRKRKAILGLMIQLDGSPHDWFEGRATSCTLLVFIDDATSQIMWLEFVNAEATIAVMQATKNYIQRYGMPHSFYTDYGSVFHVNLNNKENIKLTQWQRACNQLGIITNRASSPQAKGRVERCNKTMQDRLVKEMRLAGISSIDEANHYLRTSNFIKNHNAKFSVKASEEGNAHIDYKHYDLDNIFSIHETRVLANDFTITHKKRILQLHSQQQTIIRPKDEIIVKTSLNGIIKLWVRNTELTFSEINYKPNKIIQERPIFNHKPSENSRRWAAGLPFKESRSRMKPALPAVEAI